MTPRLTYVNQNVKAMDIQCQICKSTFLKTTRAPQYVILVLQYNT